MAGADALPTVGQRLLWAFERRHPDQGLLNVTSCYRIRGPLDTDALRGALERTVARHEALRTTYRSARGRLICTAHDELPPLFTCFEGIPTDLPALLATTLREPLDLEQGPARGTLWREGDQTILQLTVHHLSTDGWSGGVVARDLAAAYRVLTGVDSPAEAAPAAAYSDFAAWQADRMQGRAFELHRAFWQRRLDGLAPPILTSSGATDPADTATVSSVRLDAAFRSALDALLAREGVSAYTFFLSALATVLHRRSGQDRLGVSSMFANRARRVDQGTVGFFANLAVLPLEVAPDDTRATRRQRLKRTVFETLIHQELPYHLVPRRGGDERLDSVMFQLATGPGYDLDLGDDLRVTQEPAGQLGSRFDLELAVHPVSGAGYEATLWWSPERFDTLFAHAVLAEFAQECRDAVIDPAVPVGAGKEKP